MTFRFTFLTHGLAVLALVACSKGGSHFVPETGGYTLSLAEFSAQEGERGGNPSNCATECRRRRQEFRWVVYIGKQIYCYWEEKRAETRTNFDALATELEAKITDDTSLTGYYLVLQAWASAFHDGHVNALAGKESENLEVYTAPVRLETLAAGTEREKVIIASSSAALLNPGDEVTHVNGKTVKEALDAALTRTSGSTARMRRYKAARLLVDAMGVDEGGQDLKLTVKTPAGEVSLPRTVEMGTKPTPPPSGNIRAVILPGSIGLMWLGGFGGPDAEKTLDDAMDRLASTRALILDLRQNHGGDLSGDRIIARLIDRNVVRYRRSERMSDVLIAARPSVFFPAWNGTDLFAPWRSLHVAPATRRYRAPVVAITGPECFSACDTFVASLKANALATIVGEGTGGGTGTPHVFNLTRSGFKFRYSVVRGRTPSNDMIEGRGTLPDILVEPTPVDRAIRRDPQIARALETVGRRAGIPSAITTPVPAFPAMPHAIDSLVLSPTRTDAIRLDTIADIDERE